ncbi:site-2 protease family protein [Ruminococcus flavefaciens]|nr:site-2 protease family protein [Ruminococcus flavefaciens]
MQKKGLIMFSGGLSGDKMVIYAIRLLVFLLIIPIHESAHGLMAKWLGDDTAKKEGRISLNPFVHLDLAGLVLMLLMGFGWAKPVPVNISNIKHRRAGYALVSAAGPLSNILAAFVGAAIFNTLYYTKTGQMAVLDSISGAMNTEHNILSAVLMLLLMFVNINVTLALFNLIPLPPLDGFNLVRAFLPVEADRWIYAHQRQISTAFILLLLLAANIPEVSEPLIVLIEKVEGLIWSSVEWIIPLVRK